MPLDRLTAALDARVRELERKGIAKGAEAVVAAVEAPRGDRGPRFRLAGEGERAFIRLNSNSYLGMSLRPEVVAAGEAEARAFGAGPGAVRFISGTYAAHVELERRLARFHGRAEAMLFSSAYAAVVGCLVPLVDSDTALVSDELNHNSIINAVRLARPRSKAVYPHLDMRALERALEKAAGNARRAVVVTDGVFSMRGVHAPVDEIMEIARRRDSDFPENVVVVLDDSHGVGAIGATGRGTEECTGSPPADVLVATLGKALGVNGGYVATHAALVRHLRESAPFYVYSNPITPGEARAALEALEILDSAEGVRLLDRLRSLVRRFEEGLKRLGIEVLEGDHPVVPLMIRDTARTHELVRHLRDHGVLATGLTFPVVPRGDEEIRAQINADHTEADVDYVLDVLAKRPRAGRT